MKASRRVTVVASELLGRAATGGAGTADSLLAVALGRHGHHVELLVASGRDVTQLSDRWRNIYADAGVRVRVLRHRPDVRPQYLAPPFEVYESLRERPPDVVIANDWRGLAFTALQARQAGLAFENTAFVVHCHGPGRVLAAFAQKVPDTLERFGESVAERTALGLADLVVSPSAWLLRWMHEHEWPVSADAHVIQYLREWVAFGEEPPRPPAPAPLRRIAFFGQLREGKGVRIFVDALHALDARLRDRVELLFLGSARGRWTPETISGALPTGADARFETQLDRDAALAEVRKPGTLAVMPSLLDNSPNTVAECIEQGIPFVATNVGGVAELVAERDRARVLCAPNARELARALTRALTSSEPFAPAAPAREPHEALEEWLRIVGSVAAPRRRTKPPARAEFDLVVGEDDAPDEDLMATLLRAQAASDADVVTAAVRASDGSIHLFLGDPGALGLIENQYGTVALIRRALVSDEPIWPLLARVALAGARIVSVPEPLATVRNRPGRVDDVPGDSVAVLEAFERSGGAALTDLPQLAATAAAALVRDRPPDGLGGVRDGIVARARRRLRR